ncbi:phosphotransferase family protein [Bacillus sp. FJAT-26390]|uniref:phosphotransferase family protein n=1 Tax=Bacillus sp. FJAT-26390 TaxID=1743142 RepID=UPI0008080C6E|nr:aminoglycoside phosphotransferase family protein [Bacillus sp. FJAT-26390]OBZ08664.1 aminoglycoside phosphotransferase [Bacillus sp. FJAT-26390]
MITSDSKDQLSDRMLQWVIDAVHPQAVVRSIQRLHGGMSSIMHSIVLHVNDDELKVVLRQVDNAEWLQEEPDLALHEAESLRLVAQTAVPTPRILAYDVTGDSCGIPAVLMTQLAGTVVLRPPSMESWIDGLAETLAQIHKVEADHFTWTYFTYQDLSTFESPSWSTYTECWDKVVALVKGPQPKAKPSLIHRDYHPANVVWKDGKASGVVDWVNACRGPAGIDVGHCRVDLAQLYDVETADAFLKAYMKYAGPSFQYEPYWDLLSLVDILFGQPTVYAGWAAFGVNGLTDALMAERLDNYMLSLLSK